MFHTQCPVTVFTFGQPRVGNAKFREAYDVGVGATGTPVGKRVLGVTYFTLGLSISSWTRIKPLGQRTLYSQKGAASSPSL